MNEQELMKSYLEMPEVQLLMLLNLDFEKLFQIEKQTREEWINKRKCGCCYNEDILNKRLILRCEHLKQELNIKKEKIRKKIRLKSDTLNFASLIRVNRFRQRLHRL